MEKGSFEKSKGPYVMLSADIYKVLSRPVDYDRPVVVKLKQDLKYGVHIYFQQVRPCAIYQALNYLKSHNERAVRQ